jgi:D-glycero-alpha-D-manno-heptose-7-phosphate kinase
MEAEIALYHNSTDRKEGEYIINAVAPIRLGDVGGWTDTHFACFGKVCNIAVYPYVEVQCTVRPASGSERARTVTVYAENYDLHYELSPSETGKLPLVDAAIKRMNIPSDVSIEVRIHSQVPPGASTGTSAAVSVAIIGALDMLTPGRLTPYEVARLAHKIETEDLGLQSGIQDQLASAFGGINLIDIPQFPHANVAPIALSASHWWDLESRLSLVYIGKPHNSRCDKGFWC